MCGNNGLVQSISLHQFQWKNIADTLMSHSIFLNRYQCLFLAINCKTYSYSSIPVCYNNMWWACKPWQWVIMNISSALHVHVSAQTDRSLLFMNYLWPLQYTLIQNIITHRAVLFGKALRSTHDIFILYTFRSQSLMRLQNQLFDFLRNESLKTRTLIIIRINDEDVEVICSKSNQTSKKRTNLFGFVLGGRQ